MDGASSTGLLATPQAYKLALPYNPTKTRSCMVIPFDLGYHTTYNLLANVW